MPLERRYRNGIWLAVALSISGLYFVFKTIPPINLRTGAPRINWLYIGTGFLVLLAVWLSKSARMYLIGNGMGAKIKLRRHFQIYMATCFISHVTPFNSGGTPLQIYLLHRQGISIGKASAITVVDLGINTIIFFLLVAITVIQRGSSVNWRPWLVSRPGVGIFLIILICISLLVVIFFFWNQRACARNIRIKIGGWPLKGGFTKLPGWMTYIPRKIYSFLQKKGWPQNFQREYSLFKEGWQSLTSQNPAQVIGVIAFTVIYWLLYLSLAPLIMAALGRPVTFSGPVSYTGLMGEQLFFNLVQVFIPTPGGSGGSELIMSYLFQKITGPARIGWFVLLWKIYTFFSTLIIGGYFFIRLALLQEKNQ